MSRKQRRLPEIDDDEDVNGHSSWDENNGPDLESEEDDQEDSSGDGTQQDFDINVATILCAYMDQFLGALTEALAECIKKHGVLLAPVECSVIVSRGETDGISIPFTIETQAIENALCKPGDADEETGDVH